MGSIRQRGIETRNPHLVAVSGAWVSNSTPQPMAPASAHPRPPRTEGGGLADGRTRCGRYNYRPVSDGGGSAARAPQRMPFRRGLRAKPSMALSRGSAVSALVEGFGPTPCPKPWHSHPPGAAEAAEQSEPADTLAPAGGAVKAAQACCRGGENAAWAHKRPRAETGTRCFALLCSLRGRSSCVCGSARPTCPEVRAAAAGEWRGDDIYTTVRSKYVRAQGALVAAPDHQHADANLQLGCSFFFFGEFAHLLYSAYIWSSAQPSHPSHARCNSKGK